MNKKILSLLSLLIIGSLLMNPLSVSAAVVNEVMTPPASWGAPTGPVLSLIDAGGEASSPSLTDTTVALRNAPSLSFNPGLDALILAGGTDDTVHEAGAFAISSDETTCPDDTPVTITVGSSVSTIVDMTGTIPNPSDNNSSHALFDTSGPSVPYLSVSDNENIGDTFNHPGGSYTTTFGNLDNMFMIANVEVVESAITNAPNGSEASTTESIPSITLTYDDAGCPPVAPTASNAEVTRTIVSPDTASGDIVVAGSSYDATDANGDDLTYSISDGNDEGYFEIDSTTGDISTTRENVPVGRYVMTVLVEDGNGGTVEVIVTIIVTDSGEVLADTGANTYLYFAIAITLLLPSTVYLKRRFNK